ncbi:unnamed protein product [Effrenium voratum]|nr:unnamed protein product [Effrenium voratum]
MKVFKEHGTGLGFDSPLRVAEAIRDALPANSLIGEISVAPQGFVAELALGLARSTIIGESIRRVLEFCGHEVHGLNHVGDWGTQFGMLIEYMKETYPNFQDQLPEVHDLQEFYKASKKRFDEDADFKVRAQRAVVDLQAGGEFARTAWEKICEVSRLAFNRIYARLNISIEDCFSTIPVRLAPR